ncbi:MAG: FKBP-type peptidyl-prolyl cis-trans isomerase [Mucilaginibacter sp.]|uniref:FKBP-type peptidyl-prolyl cis-trans isomerase n=1 Tax=Mucilaginibacter sp. TaxID=1882438 RepID=UPI0034E42757
MKKSFLLFAFFTLVFSACKKSSTTTPTFDPAVQAKIDDDKIQAYLKANPSITATKDPSGLYYQIIAQGSGTAPTVNSNVRVAYRGTLLDGTQFDTNANFSHKLGPTTDNNGNIVDLGLIKGWQIGIPFIKPGGRILLIIPSALGYGNNPQSGIPANSVLVFTIDLFAVQG